MTSFFPTPQGPRREAPYHVCIISLLASGVHLLVANVPA